MVADEGRARDRGARFLIIAASLVIVVAGLRAAGQLILPFLVSVFLAIISLPLMKWLQRKGAPTGVAVLVTVLADVAVLAGLLIIVGRAVNEFTAAAPSYQARLQQLMGFTLAWIEARGIETAGWSAPEFINPGALVDLVGGTLRAVAAVAQNTFLVILTMIFILSEAAGFSDKLRVAFGSRPAISSGSGRWPSRCSATWRSRRWSAWRPACWSGCGCRPSASIFRCSGGWWPSSSITSRTSGRFSPPCRPCSWRPSSSGRAALPASRSAMSSSTSCLPISSSRISWAAGSGSPPWS